MPQENEKCCEHNCYKNQEEEITSEEAVKILKEDIPFFLKKHSKEFNAFSLFEKVLGVEENQEKFHLTGETAGEGFLLHWNLFLWVGSAWPLRLSVEYTGGKLEITQVRIYDENRLAEIISSGDLPAKAVKALYADLLNLEHMRQSGEWDLTWAKPSKIREWNHNIRELICEKTGLNIGTLGKIMNNYEAMQKIIVKMNAYKEGLKKAIQGLEESKQFTKSPQLKELREELEIILDPNKHAYEFYNN
ncbi:MAG: hypothetical protein WDZ40_01125 [Candidatus Spechtbacterales bacterium]